jgi:hypothetical protein
MIGNAALTAAAPCRPILPSVDLPRSPASCNAFAIAAERYKKAPLGGRAKLIPGNGYPIARVGR